MSAYDKPYITYRGSIPMAVRCKGACPAVLVQRQGLSRNLAMLPTVHYTELVIEMLTDTGLLGKHETAVCKACRERILASPGTPEVLAELRAIYDQDVVQWKVSAMTAAKPRATREQADKMASRFASFKPIQALDERGRGDRGIF